LEELKLEIAKMVAPLAGVKEEDVLPTIEAGKMGDLSCKIAFSLSKERKENPAKLAADMAHRLEKGGNFDRI
jgi:arginyl-tRNA synthetase